jgi:hypothetical protein
MCGVSQMRALAAEIRVTLAGIQFSALEKVGQNLCKDASED